MAAQALVRAPSYCRHRSAPLSTNVMVTANVLAWPVRSVPSCAPMIVVTSDRVYETTAAGRPHSTIGRPAWAAIVIRTVTLQGAAPVFVTSVHSVNALRGYNALADCGRGGYVSGGGYPGPPCSPRIAPDSGSRLSSRNAGRATLPQPPLRPGSTCSIRSPATLILASRP